MSEILKTIKMKINWRSLKLYRRFHAFSIGAPKTGTHSIAAIFSKNYRSNHEPIYEDSIKLLSEFYNNKITHLETVNDLKKRDRRLRLEMESSHIIGLLYEQLSEAFPKALFIVTIRDIMSWLDSNFNHQLNHPHISSSPWYKMQCIYFEPSKYNYNNGDIVLKNNNLFPLEGYIAFWFKYYCNILKNGDSERILLVPTFEIKKRINRIANHVKVKPNSLDPKKSHSFKVKKRHNIIEKIDPNYLKKIVISYRNRMINKSQNQNLYILKNFILFKNE